MALSAERDSSSAPASSRPVTAAPRSAVRSSRTDGREEELARRLVEARQHLLHEVAGHGPVAPRELTQEHVRVAATGQRDGGERDARGPALGELLQVPHLVVLEREIVPRQQLAGVVEREAQVPLPHLDQSFLKAQARQVQVRLGPRPDDHVQVGRGPADQHLDELDAARVADEMKVVEDEPRVLGSRPGELEEAGDERGTDPARRGLVVQLRRRAGSGGADGSEQRLGHDLWVVVLAVERRPPDEVAAPFQLASPVGEQRRLAGSDGAGDEHRGAAPALGRRRQGRRQRDRAPAHGASRQARSPVLGRGAGRRRVATPRSSVGRTGSPIGPASPRTHDGQRPPRDPTGLLEACAEPAGRRRRGSCGDEVIPVHFREGSRLRHVPG